MTTTSEQFPDGVYLADTLLDAGLEFRLQYAHCGYTLGPRNTMKPNDGDRIHRLPDTNNNKIWCRCVQDGSTTDDEYSAYARVEPLRGTLVRVGGITPRFGFHAFRFLDDPMVPPKMPTEVPKPQPEAPEIFAIALALQQEACGQRGHTSVDPRVLAFIHDKDQTEEERRQVARDLLLSDCICRTHVMPKGLSLGLSS